MPSANPTTVVIKFLFKGQSPSSKAAKVNEQVIKDHAEIVERHNKNKQQIKDTCEENENGTTIDSSNDTSNGPQHEETEIYAAPVGTVATGSPVTLPPTTVVDLYKTPGGGVMEGNKVSSENGSFSSSSITVDDDNVGLVDLCFNIGILVSTF